MPPYVLQILQQILTYEGLLISKATNGFTQNTIFKIICSDCY